MNYSQCILGLLFVVSVSFKYSTAIQCYVCNSHEDKSCLDDENYKLSDNFKQDCPEKTSDGHPYILCRKIKQVIDFEVNGLQPDSRIIRTCGWDDSHYKNRCYQRSGFGGRQEVCACEEDGCNGNNTIFASITLIISLLVLLKIYQ